MTDEERRRLHARVGVWLATVGDGDEQRKLVANGVRAWHFLKQDQRRAEQKAPGWKPITFEELAADIEAGKLEVGSG